MTDATQGIAISDRLIFFSGGEVESANFSPAPYKKRKGVHLKFRTCMWNIAMCLFAALAITLQLSAQDKPDHQPTIITFDVPGAGTNGATGQGTLALALTRRGRLWDSPVTRTTCATPFCALRTAPSRRSTSRARAQAPSLVRAPTPSTLLGRSPDTTMTQAVWITATCALPTAPSRRSTLRVRAQAPPGHLPLRPGSHQPSRGDHGILR